MSHASDMLPESEAGGPQAKVLVEATHPEKRPTFSVVLALFDVEAYFGATIDSLRRQTIAVDELEFIVVDDGSDDASLRLAEQWARRDDRVTVVAKEHSGVADTREIALRHARGKWLTAVDPDDVVAEDYFAEALKADRADVNNELALISTRVMVVNGATGEYKDSHPLGAKYRRGNRVVCLDDDPNAIQMGANCFLRMDMLREKAIHYDANVYPSFEDGHLVGRYLCHFKKPYVALVATAWYFYRKRKDGSSAVQSGWAAPEKYVMQPEYGFLNLFKYAHEIRGKVPLWMGCMVLYDLMWYLKEYHVMSSKVRWVDDQAMIRERFMALVREIFALLTVEHLRALTVNPPSWELRVALEIGMGLDGTPGRWVRRKRNGEDVLTVLVRADIDDIEVFHNGAQVHPVIIGGRSFSLFGETMMRVVECVVGSGDIAVFANGQLLPRDVAPRRAVVGSDERAERMTEALRGVSRSALTPGEKRRRRLRVRSWITNKSVGHVAGAAVMTKVATMVRRGSDQAVLDASLKERVEKRASHADEYQHAWLIMDRPGSADDNGEHLYRHLLNMRPDINAFYVLSRTSSAWKRLAEEGFRLLPYGEEECWVAALRADVVASADAVAECIFIAPRRIWPRPTYKFVFLQHGVSEKDISTWLYGKRIDLMVTSVVGEYENLAYGPFRYEFTSRTVALTGMARFDALLEKAGRRSECAGDGSRRTLLVMPTWRASLKSSLDRCVSDEERRSVLRESPYFKEWCGFMDSSGLRERVHSGEIQIKFVAHSGLARYSHLVDFPAHVHVVHPSEESYQSLFVEADMFVTDYSSTAFDVGYIGRPVLYFQSEQDPLESGAHTWTKGWFDYESNGIGPVATSVDQAGAWVCATLDSGCVPEDGYVRRAADMFPFRDGSSCARIVAAIEDVLQTGGMRLAAAVADVVPQRVV